MRISEKIILVLGTIICILCLFIIPFIYATSDIALADMYYEEAQKLYDSGECKNASEYIERALNLYMKYNNQPGIEKCNELIVKINKCLRDQGYNFYLQALQYFNQGDYENAKIFAERAKSLYVLVPYIEGIANCDELIQNAKRKIEELIKEQGERLYENARAYYAKKDYPNAKISANRAKEKFLEISYADGISRCEALLKNIDIDIVQTNERANVYYTEAEKWRMKADIEPKFKNFNLAKEYAENASKLYSLVNNTEGYAKCLTLISVIQNKLAENEERLNNEAKNHYDKAELSYLEARRFFYEEKYDLTYALLNNASTHSIAARSIYTELLKWARELKSAKKREEKVQYYQKKIRECKKQGKKIEKFKKEIEERREAERLYQYATKLYNDAFYDNASATINETKKIFEKVGDWVGVSKCNTLILKINQALEIKAQADKFYENASSKYRVAKFDEAISDLMEARRIYQGINRKQDIEKCDSLLENITKGNKSKNRAEQFYQKALDFHERGTFPKSNDYAKDARKIFEKINFSEGVQRCDELIAKNDELLEEEGKKHELYKNIIFAAVVISTFAIILRWWLEKRKKVELRRRALEAERRRREEERRRREEKERRKEEARLRELREERERLKAELEKEKSKLMDKGGEL
jgi:tetratricopeptide (TPR) repeat protein